MIYPSSPAGRGLLATGNRAEEANPTTSAPSLPPPKEVDPNHFPTALHRMLNEIDNNEGAAASAAASGDEFSSIVSWQPHGKCFLIHNEKKFCDSVLPKYFCRLKYTSLQRQLHFHGFKRLCKQGTIENSLILLALLPLPMLTVLISSSLPCLPLWYVGPDKGGTLIHCMLHHASGTHR